ncbi:hypothetical protein EON63_18100, partial [archaeon]
MSEEWKELDTLYRLEAKKKRSRFSPEQLEARQQMLVSMQTVCVMDYIAYDVPTSRNLHSHTFCTPYTIHHIPYTIHHTPYTIYHIPYTIHHIPYTIYH